MDRINHLIGDAKQDRRTGSERPVYRTDDMSQGAQIGDARLDYQIVSVTQYLQIGGARQGRRIGM